MYGRDAARISSLELSGIQWCSGEEAVSFQEYLWFREYPGLQELIHLHQKFLTRHEEQEESYDQSINTGNEDFIFQVSDNQSKLLSKIYKLYN